MRKKLSAICFVALLLLSYFSAILIVSQEPVKAIGQHESTSGTTYGHIYNSTELEGTKITEYDTDADGLDDLYGICSDGTYIYALDNPATYDWQYTPSGHDRVYKYDMDFNYIEVLINFTFNTSGEGNAKSITTDGSNIWILDPEAVEYTPSHDYDIHKFDMDGNCDILFKVEKDDLKSKIINGTFEWGQGN